MVHSYTGTHGVKKKTLFVSTQPALVLGHQELQPLRSCLGLTSVSRSLCSFVDEAREFLPGVSSSYQPLIFSS